MKQEIKLFLAVLILVIIAYYLGKSQVSAPEKIEVVKVVEKEVIKEVQSVEKTTKAKNTSVKHTSSDGSVTETTSSEIEISDKQISEFLSDKLKSTEVTKISNHPSHGFGLDVGLNKEKEILADFEYLKYTGEIFDKPIYFKLDLGFKFDKQSRNLNFTSGKIGSVIFID